MESVQWVLWVNDVFLYRMSGRLFGKMSGEKEYQLVLAYMD